MTDHLILECAVPGARIEWLHGAPYTYGESMIDRVARTRAGIVNGRPVDHDGETYVPAETQSGEQYLISSDHIVMLDAYRP